MHIKRYFAIAAYELHAFQARGICNGTISNLPKLLEELKFGRASGLVRKSICQSAVFRPVQKLEFQVSRLMPSMNARLR